MTLYNVVGTYWNGSAMVPTSKTSVNIPGATANAVNYTSAIVVAPNINGYLVLINNVEACPGVRWQVGSVSISAVKNDIACDCLNGNCVPATQYNTGGLYGSVADCQAGCAKNSPCIGECVSSADLANLQQAAGNLRSRICG